MRAERLSANLGFLWPERPLLARIDAAAAAGFRAIELHWPYDVPAAAVADRCHYHGLTLLALNTVRGDVAAGENGLGALAGRETEFQASVDQAIAYAVAAGAGAVHCMAGVAPPSGRAVLAANMRAAADRAARDGLTLLLEPLNAHDAPGYVYHTPAEAAAVIAAVDRPNVKLMFDCYHVARGGGDVIMALADFLPFIGHVQIAAVPDRAEPDTGTLDYAAVFAALDRLDYRGWIGAEYKPAAATDAGLDWIAALCC